MSSLSEKWRILPFSNRDDGPPKLLFKFIISSDGFELYVTDILHCWKSSGDRTSIAREAARTHSSIDPSEDATQFQVLLSKIRDGLMGRNGGRCKIGSVYADAADTEPLRAFTLHSRTPLPPPLQPLHWRFDLLQEGQMLLTRELILPALASELKQQTQIEDLKRQIEQKDHVITRLMDKIEQSSMDLSLVFPGYSSGRKGLTAKQATKVVPGISKFDETAWEKDFGGDELATTRSLAEAFRKPGTDQLWFESPLDRYGEDASWEAFGKVASYWNDWMSSGEREPVFTEDEGSTDAAKSHHPRTSTAMGPNGGGNAPGLATEESNQAFEDATNTEKTWKGSIEPTSILQSPPRPDRKQSPSSDDSSPVGKTRLVKVGNLGSRSKNPPVSRHPVRNRRDSSTASESASDSPAPEKKPKKSSKLGTIGGSKKASQAMASRQSSSPPPASPKTSTPSGKLGGGKKGNTLRSSPPGPHSPQAETSTSQHTPSRKLGVLGGRHQSATPQKTEIASKSASQHHTHHEDLDATDSPSLSPSPSAARPSHSTNMKEDPIQKASTEPAEEPLTTEEIADRKREELKRTFGAGGGKKKRRKF